MNRPPTRLGASGYRELAELVFDRTIRLAERAVARVRHVGLADVPPSAELERWLPHARFSDSVFVWSAASERQLVDALMKVTLDEMPLARALSGVRYLPSFGRGEPIDARRPFFPELLSTRGCILLSRGEQEIVIGTIGKLHRVVDREPVELHTPEDFARFGALGYERLAMSIRVLRRGSRCLLVLEHRTSPVDADAEHHFAFYWLMLGPGASFVSRDLLRAVARRARRSPRTPNAEMRAGQR